MDCECRIFADNAVPPLPPTLNMVTMAAMMTNVLYKYKYSAYSVDMAGAGAAAAVAVSV